MAAGINKKSKAERQAQLGLEMRTKSSPVVVVIPPDDEDEDINSLLGNDPTPATKQKATRERKSSGVLRERSLKGQMVAFHTKKGELVVGHGVRYWVARMDGKLHYKEESQVTFLPDDWKDGDPIPE